MLFTLSWQALTSEICFVFCYVHAFSAELSCTADRKDSRQQSPSHVITRMSSQCKSAVEALLQARRILCYSAVPASRKFIEAVLQGISE